MYSGPQPAWVWEPIAGSWIAGPNVSFGGDTVAPDCACDNNSKEIPWSATSKLKEEPFFCTAAPWVETEEVEK